MKNSQIPFNKPYLSGNELAYTEKAIQSGNLAGNQYYTQKCQRYIEEEFEIYKCLLTTSCTDALEMCALLLDIKEGDEVIMPSYTFVSTANAFALRNATIRFVDCSADRPSIDSAEVAQLITPKTKALVVVHYAGISCEMQELKALCQQNGIALIEDAAQAMGSHYVEEGVKYPLGSIGDMATYSFHETKNISCGEGGALLINNPRYTERAEVLWEKGTNRTAFSQGKIDKYSWIDVGSSFLPSELTSAYLAAQLENRKDIQAKRKDIWERYYHAFFASGIQVELPYCPDYSTNNHHLFYILCKSEEERNAFIAHMKGEGIQAIFHYIPLHSSPYFETKHDGRTLAQTDRFASTLVRLPLYYELSKENQDRVIRAVIDFYS